MQGSPMFTVCKKIKETKNDFRRWNKECFGNIQTRIREKWEQLDKVQKEEPTQENLQREASINLEF